MYQLPVGIEGRLGEQIHEVAGDHRVVVVAGSERRGERRRHQGLEVPGGGDRTRVLRGHHLALLGDADVAVHRAHRLREDRLMGGAPAATDRPAASVEQPEVDPVTPGHGDEGALGPMERPLRHEIAAVLVRVGVADHDLLQVTEGGHSFAIHRQ